MLAFLKDFVALRKYGGWALTRASSCGRGEERKKGKEKVKVHLLNIDLAVIQSVLAVKR